MTTMVTLGQMKCILVLLFLSLSSYQCKAAVCNSADRAALLTFKSDGALARLVDCFNLLSDWNPSNPNCCTWTEEGAPAVTCNSAGRVISLILSGRVNVPSGNTATLRRDTSFTGSFASSIGSFTYLQTLEFDFMGFNGAGIPSSWANLYQLQSVILTYGDITGNLVGSVISSWPLQTLKLQNNGFTGSLPSELCHVRLTTLTLINSDFSGAIPTCLSRYSAGAFQPGNAGLCGVPLAACK